MLRWKNLIAPVAALALVIGFHQTQLRADDAAAPAKGKAKVTITVVDSSGKVVEGAKVSIFPKMSKKQRAAATSQPTDGTAAAKPTPMSSGETAADGTFAMTEIPNGDFTVRARLKGSGNGNAVVTVADDKDETVTITLKQKAPKN
jgi:hypothetical protein